MYDFIPKRQNNKARLAVLLLGCASAVAFFGSSLTPKYPAVLQTIGLLLLVPLIQITGRYLAVHYLYRLKEHENGGADFEVYSYRGGARMQLVCRVGLDEITAAEKLCEQNRRPQKNLRRYNYLPDMAPADATVLSISNADGECELLLAPDAYLDGVFAAAVQRNAEIPTAKQEEE